jgi:ORF6N domain-containing protein
MSNEIIPVERIAQAILYLRDQKVILDFALAALYGVETRALKQAVRRNLNRFPGDFMFELSEREIGSLVSQTVIAAVQKVGGATPMAFTEQRVAMLSSVFRSERPGKHDEKNGAIIEAIRQLMAPPAKPHREIGFHVREKAPRYRTRNGR